MKKILLLSVLAAIALSFGACGSSNTGNSEQPITTHTFEKHEAVTPTCDTEGNAVYYTCADCGKFFDENQKEIASIPVIEALGHAYNLVMGTGATCHEKGILDYYTCGVCNKLFDLTKKEITDVVADYDKTNHTSEASLTLQTPPRTTTYYVGEKFDPTGMAIIYKCADCEGEIVDNQFLTYTYQTEGANQFANGDIKITVSHNGASLDMAVTVEKGQAQILGVADAYETVCGIAPEINVTSNLPDSVIEIAYYDGETEIQPSAFVVGKTYIAKVVIAETETMFGAEKAVAVTVKHGYTWQYDAEDWKKLTYVCACGDIADFYAMNYQTPYVDKDHLEIDLSAYVVGSDNVSVKEIQQIVRMKNGEYVEAVDGDLVDITYTNNGMLYTFTEDKYEKALDNYKPYILTLSVVYSIDGVECPVVVEAKLADKLIRSANDLTRLAYLGAATVGAGGTANTGYYVLANDIDAKDLVLEESKFAWEDAIGFCGVFEGNGYTIRNLNVNAWTNGLFGALGAGSKVQNVTFENLVMGDGAHLFALVARKTMFTNVTVEFSTDSSSYLLADTANACTFNDVNVTLGASLTPFVNVDDAKMTTLPTGITLHNFAQYTVTFDSDGGSEVPSVTVISGKKVENPVTPVKESKDYDYTFLGWFLDDTEWDFNNAITQDITLVAKWQATEKLNETQLIETAISAINALPESVNLPAQIYYVPAIMNAKAAYDVLSDNGKAEVANATKLEGLLAAIKGYESVYVPNADGVKAIPCHVVNNPSTVEATGVVTTDVTQGSIFVATSGVGGRTSIQFKNFPDVSAYDKIYFYVRGTTEGYLYLSDGTGNGGWGANWKNNYDLIAANYGKNQVVKNVWCLMEFDVSAGYFTSDWAFGVWSAATDYTLEVGAIVGCKTSELPQVEKTEVTLSFGVQTDSGESNEYGKIYNITREQWYIQENITNTMGTLQANKLANALPNGFDHFEFWVYNPLTTANRFHLAGDVEGAWTDSADTITLAAQSWTKVTISNADIQLNKQGQWYVYVLDGGMDAAGWKISTIYAVK